MSNSKYLLLILSTFIITIIHISISNVLAQDPVIILPLLFVFFLFYFTPITHAYLFTILLGLMLDVFSILPFGAHTVALLFVVSILLLLTKTIISKQTTISKAALTASLTLIYLIILRTVEHIQLTIFQSVYHEIITSSQIWSIILIVIIQTTIIALLSIFLGRRRLYNLRPHILN